MKIVWLTSLLRDIPRLSSPKARLRHGWRRAHLSLLNLTLNLCILSFALSLALLSHHNLCLTSQLFFFQEVGFGLRRLPGIPLFCVPAKDLKRARGYLSELRGATWPEECRSSFCFPFFPDEFLAAATNVSFSTATGLDKVAYSMLKNLPPPGMDFLLHFFNFSWSMHCFPSIWKISSIIPIHKIGKSLNSPAYFLRNPFTSCASKLLNASFYLVYFFCGI